MTPSLLPHALELDDISAYVEAHRQEYLERLAAYVRQPSISAHGLGIAETAAFIAAELARVGLDARIMPTTGWPMMLATRVEDPAAPTVLLYGHYDVQPPDPLGEWLSPPFEPAIRDGRIYARGVGDNKGQHFAQILALEALLACRGALPCNVTVLLEGEEEIGSPHLPAFVREQRDRLGADLVVISDGPVDDSGRSVIRFGVRGVISFELRAHEGVFKGYLSPDGRHAYYLRDTGGGERGHYVRIPWEGGPEQDVTPDLPPYAALYRCAVSDDGRMFAFAPTEADGFPLYCLDLRADGTVGAPRELYRSPKLVDDVALSSDAALAVVATTEYARTRQYSLLAFETASGRRVGELSDLPAGSVRAVTFSPLPGDPRLLCQADRSGYTRPVIWDPASGERTDLSLGDLAGDIEGLDWSLDGRRILLRQISRAVQQLYTYDLGTGALTVLRHPGGTYGAAWFGPQGRIDALWGDTTHLPQLAALDGDTGGWQETILAAGEAPPARPLRSVSFRSSDGEEVQGWLGLPDGVGPFPTILSVHGGPHIAIPDFYNPGGQAWLDHGYAYLTVNYRGSTTFGRAFKEKIWGGLGHWEVEDMVAARDWLLREGIARPDAILVTGASYGGYLTLMALGTRPDLWAGGMALVAPADFITNYDDGTDWSKGYRTAMMGGTPEEKPARYAASSPITYAERVTAPLLVIQGRNDLRCPPRQMERYAEKMRALGKPFEIDWFDAGHGGLDDELFISFQERMLGFARRILRERGEG